jgi:hypothetical protein
VIFSSPAGNANENGKSTKGTRETFEIILILSASASLQNVMLSEELSIVVDEFENLVPTPSAAACVWLNASAVETCSHFVGVDQMEPMRVSVSIRISLKRGQAVLSHTMPTDRFCVMYEGMSKASPFELSGMTASM